MAKNQQAFSKLGLSDDTLKGIRRLGYSQPTPIQRIAIPEILSGRDIVAEARTGSGKTAAFLIPILERFPRHSSHGPRCLLLSPTHELALQTLSFAKKLLQPSNLKIAVLIGGAALEDHFVAMQSQPDVIIATPGRLLHIVVEMNMKLDSIEYVVLDEGDRLFEMGLTSQLKEVWNKISVNRQSLIFSATLPATLMDFAKIGLKQPKHIQLDRDKRISDDITIDYLYCKDHCKDALLIFLLSEVISKKEMTLVFLPTKLQAEYAQNLLQSLNLKSTEIHSQLDPEARRNHMNLFTSGAVNILLASDAAARGVDIPLLDNVINWDFPDSCKLFIHRLGRVGRGGKKGRCINLISANELSAMLHVHNEVGRPINYARKDDATAKKNCDLLGRVPHDILDVHLADIMKVVQNSPEIESLVLPCSRALAKRQSLALKTRNNKLPGPVVKQGKALLQDLEKGNILVHPLIKKFGNVDDNYENFLCQLKQLQPKQSVFESMGKSSVNESKIKEQVANIKRNAISDDINVDDEATSNFKPLPIKIFDAFSLDFEGGGINGGAVDILGDEEENYRRQGNQLKKWDERKRRFVGESGDDGSGQRNKKIKTESGAWISASYSTGRYAKWLKTNRAELVSSSAMNNNNRSSALVMGVKNRRKNNSSRRTTNTSANKVSNKNKKKINK